MPTKTAGRDYNISIGLKLISNIDDAIVYNTTEHMPLRRGAGLSDVH